MGREGSWEGGRLERLLQGGALQEGLEPFAGGALRDAKQPCGALDCWAGQAATRTLPYTHSAVHAGLPLLPADNGWLLPTVSPRQVLLDVGMIAKLTREDQHNLVGFFKVRASMRRAPCWGIGFWGMGLSGWWAPRHPGIVGHTGAAALQE